MKGNPKTSTKDSASKNAPKAGGKVVQGKGNRFTATGRGK